MASSFANVQSMDSESFALCGTLWWKPGFDDIDLPADVRYGYAGSRVSWIADCGNLSPRAK